MPKIDYFENSGITVEGAKWKDINIIKKMFKSWNEGRNLGTCKTIYLMLFSKKVCIVAKRDHLLIGYILFYVNRRDIQDGTVHEAFIVVSEKERGRGIGTFLRERSGIHFNKCDISGISSRIHEGNTASMASAEKVGFEAKERIFDPREQKEQIYLVWRF